MNVTQVVSLASLRIPRVTFCLLFMMSLFYISIYVLFYYDQDIIGSSLCAVPCCVACATAMTCFRLGKYFIQSPVLAAVHGSSKRQPRRRTSRLKTRGTEK